MEPTLNYARTRDGLTIAYTVVGRGPPLVWVSPVPMSNVIGMWRVPALRDAYEMLARRVRLIQYDGRGTGSSQRDVDLDRLGLEPMLDDLDAVVGNAGLERFALLGFYSSVAHALAYAARNPRRVTHLVLFGGSLRTLDAMAPAETQALVSLIERDWDLFAETAAHAWMGWAATDSGRPAAEAFRAAATPAVARATLEAARASDVSAEVANVVAPALVLHRQGAHQIPVEVSRRLADALPGGRLVVLDGDAPALFLDDPEGDVALVADFVTDAAPSPRDRPSPRRPDTLTPRELDVLRLLGAGESNAEIAHRLGISIHTVERHAANLYRKIGARGRADAAAYAVRRGIA